MSGPWQGDCGPGERASHGLSMRLLGAALHRGWIAGAELQPVSTVYIMFANVPLTKLSQPGPRLESIWEGRTTQGMTIKRCGSLQPPKLVSTTSSFQTPTVWKTSSLGRHFL